MRENRNDTETEYASVENPLDMHRTASNSIKWDNSCFWDSKYLINEKDTIIAPGQGKKPVSIFSYEFCKDQAFPYLLPRVNLAIKLLDIFR